MSDKTGGAAFPCTTGSDGGTAYDGMTLRDYFAAAALQGFIAGHLVTDDAKKLHGDDVATFSASAYECADAMLAEREHGR